LVIKFESEYNYNEGTTLNIRITTVDLPFNSDTEVLSKNLNQEETAKYFDPRNSSELIIDMPPYFKTHYL
jgi:hypothetical protein